MQKEAIKTLVPPQVYTNRQEHIDYFYKAALNAVPRRTMSTVLLGKRRMGKTEIFKRVVNRLFFEQDHTDPKAVVPVYYSFEDNPPNRWDFATEYLENFIRWYVAFRLRDLKVLSKTDVPSNNLIAFIKTNSPPLAKRFKGLFRTLEGFAEKTIVMPEKVAVQLPRDISDWDDSSIVMFLDEFQNTRLNGFDIVGFMQEAVESPTCPHFVTGSAMSILAKEIIGRGALFGRFRSKPISGLTTYWGTELTLRVAQHYQVSLPEIMAPVIAARCQGNPFYITAIIQQAAEGNHPLEDEENLNNILAVDLSSGFIWAELQDQVMGWIRRINDYGITKWVLYLSALEEGERIEPTRIQQQLLEKEGTNVDIETIKDILIKLSRGDLLEYMGLGGWFKKINDPILLDFLKVWGRFEVEGHSPIKVTQDTVKQYNRLKQQVNDQKGYMAEVYVSQILWNGQRKTLPGKYFNHTEDITLPHSFYNIEQRLRLGGSANSEVDVYAFGDREIWICESKWWETKKVGVKEVEDFLDLAEKVKHFEGQEYFEEGNVFRLKLWLFAYSGVSKNAKALLEKHNIYWSTRADLDALVQLAGLRAIPIGDKAKSK